MNYHTENFRNNKYKFLNIFSSLHINNKSFIFGNNRCHVDLLFMFGLRESNHKANFVHLFYEDDFFNVM
jgi:hypothetical protein